MNAPRGMKQTGGGDAGVLSLSQPTAVSRGPHVPAGVHYLRKRPSCNGAGMGRRAQ